LRRRPPPSARSPYTTLFRSSALTGQRVTRILPRILEVQETRTKRIPTHEVNEVLRELVARSKPPHAQGRPVKFLYGTQAAIAPRSEEHTSELQSRENLVCRL